MRKHASILAPFWIATLSTAMAHTNGYLGAHIGYGSARTKISRDPSVDGGTNLGNDIGNYGFFAGYGKTYGCIYVSGEVFFTLEEMKMRIEQSSGASGYLELERKRYYGAALRIGHWVKPQTLFYFRLGAHGGKWELIDTRINAGIGITHFGKNRFTLAPGVGFEVTLHKNIAVRSEWFHEFGPSIVATNDTNQALYVRAANVRYHTYRVGISYRF